MMAEEELPGIRQRMAQARDRADQVKSGATVTDIEENRRMARVARKLAETPLTAADLGLGPIGGQRQIIQEFVHNPEMLLPEEQEQINQMRRQRQPDIETRTTLPHESNWKVKSLMAETKSGQSIPVWKVGNPKIGFEHQMLFRIEEVAQKLAHILNETGNLNDPRVVRIIMNYQKRDKLLKEIRSLQNDVQGKPMKTERLKQLRSEVAQIDYKLGI